MATKEAIKSSYFGKCYFCREFKEIGTVLSWASQNGSDNKKVLGGFRPFCIKCADEMGIEVDRAVNVKKLSDIRYKADLSKYVKCSKCKMYYLKTKSWGNTCLVCYGRSKYGKC